MLSSIERTSQGDGILVMSVSEGVQDGPVMSFNAASASSPVAYIVFFAVAYHASHADDDSVTVAIR